MNEKMNESWRMLLKRCLLQFLLLGWSVLGVAQVQLPIEVLGEEGKEVSRSFELNTEQRGEAYLLWLQVNNLGYENKASVKVNDGAWLSLNHETVNMHYQEKARGGMVHGGYSTIRFTVPADGFVVGTNTLSFRFNFSDGISNGYRVVSFNLLDGDRNRLLPNEMFVEDDPETWIGPLTDEASIAEGKDLWYNAQLWNNYLHEDSTGFWYDYELKPFQTIRATCSDCHAQDGRDLELFAYSNESIVERAIFHNLSREEGEKIASYIRSLSGSANNVNRNGRPWNPPYQPGPQLKGKSIEYWHAGAGLEAVLDDDEDMIDYMFPNGVDSASVAQYFDSDKMVEWTEVPVAIQFPDWKHWLPLIHPKDAYNGNSFYDETYSNTRWPYNPERAYETFRDLLEDKAGGQGKRINIAGKNPTEMMNAHQTWRYNYRFFQAQYESGSSIVVDTDRHWRSTLGDALDNLSDGVGLEFASTSLARLMAVKNFEIMQEFELQDQAPEYLRAEDQPASRQWFHHTDSKNVFEVPAHITGAVIGTAQEFLGQPTQTGQFESTAWYQLQLVLAAGNGNQSHNGPVDYNYQPEFILRAGLNSDILEPMRYYFSLNHLYQTKTWSGDINPNNADGFRIRVQGPWYFFGKEADAGRSQFQGYDPGFWPTLLDKTRPGMTKWVLDAQIRQFLKEVQKPQNAISGWTRFNVGGNKAQNLDPENKTEGELKDVTDGFSSDVPIYADHMYWVIPLAQEFGVDCNLIEQMVDWSQEAWPLINWDQFRSQSRANLELTLVENCETGSFNVTALTENRGSAKLNWFVNESRRANSGNSFDGSVLLPGDVVRCEFTSTSACVTNSVVQAEIVIPALGFTVESRLNGESWNKEDNITACIDDVVDLKVDVNIKPIMWLDAMDVNSGSEPEDGEHVATWNDRSSTGSDANAPINDLRPQYSKNGMNGLPALLFGMEDAANGMELFDTSADDFLNDDWTILIVGQEYQNVDRAAVIGNKSGDGDGWYFDFSSGGKPRIATGNSTTHDGPESYGQPLDFISVLTYKAGQLSLIMNGQLEAQSDPEVLTTLTNEAALYLGQASNGSSTATAFHKGPISEVLVFDHSLTNEEITYLEGYLAHKWKLEDQLSPFHSYKDYSPLDVTVTGPNGESFYFDDKSLVQSIDITSEGNWGNYSFYKPDCDQAIHVLSVLPSESLDTVANAVAYSIDNGAFQSGSEVIVNETRKLNLQPNYAITGDFQWEQPNGNLMSINVNPEIENINAGDHQGIWKLHIMDEGCTRVDITLDFEVVVTPADQFLITVQVTGSGTVNVEQENYVNEGDNFEVLFVPDTTYRIQKVIVDGVDLGVIDRYLFTDIVENHEIEVIFEPQVYFDIAITIGENGTASYEEGTYIAIEGETIIIYFTPDEGYIIGDVLVNGTSVGQVSNYTFADINSDQTIEVIFIPVEYTVSATSGENGQLDPEGEIAYLKGSNVTYTVVPDDGYEVEDVLLGSSSIGPVASYTFENLSKDWSIHATFKKASYTITAYQSENGSITPEGEQVVEFGEDIVYFITPDDGFVIESLSVDDVRVDPESVYIFSDVDQDHTISATFTEEVKQYTIAITSGDHGVTDPTGEVDVDEGSDLVVSILPDEGYEIAEVLVDDVSVGTVEQYTFTGINSDHRLEAFFTEEEVIEDSVVTSVAITAEAFIYPNPFSTAITISAGKHIEDVEVLGIDGKNWRHLKDIHLMEVHITLDDLPEGVYFAVIYYGNGENEMIKLMRK